MIQKLFTIYDSAAETYSPPFVAKTLGLAMRMFETIANDQTTSVGLHPADHTLFELGEWDDNAGFISMLTAPKKIAPAIEVLKEPNFTVTEAGHKAIAAGPNGESRHA